MTRHPALASGCLVLLLAAASPAAAAPATAPRAAQAVPPAPAGAVALRAQPGTPLDAEARRLAAEDLASAGDDALVLIGTAVLAEPGGRNRPAALFVQVQSNRLCGSAGCSTSVYLPEGHGWRKVLDAVSGPIAVAPAAHRGMHDLLVQGNDRWIWNGQRYADTVPAPAIDLHHSKRPLRS